MFLTPDNRMKWKLLGVATVVAALAIGLGIAWFDKPVFLFLRSLDCRFFRFLGDVFDDKVWFCVFAAIVGVIYIKKTLETGIKYKNAKNHFSLAAVFRDFWQKTSCKKSCLIFCSILSAGVVALVLKTLIGRVRPIFYEALELTGFYPPSIDWVFNSMPSGHTAVSFATLVMIGMLAPRIKVLTWTLAVLIGVSRVAVGAHWPTDVIFGAFIGMVVADLVKWLMLRNKKACA